jgi:hypothetical protein
MMMCFESSDRDRDVARCLLAMRGVSHCFELARVAIADDQHIAKRGSQGYLRSGTSLAALAFEAANPLLPPKYRSQYWLAWQISPAYHFALIFENCVLSMEILVSHWYRFGTGIDAKSILEVS